MSKSPIIILAGNAGSGKDTVGSYLVQNYGAVTVAQADPMKRFVAEVFGFSEQQLWGPSSFRNAPDEVTVDEYLAIGERFQAYVLRALDGELFSQVVPKASFAFALDAIRTWFSHLFEGLENGIPVSPRLVLQTFGTEWGRRVSPNMWNLFAIEAAKTLLCGGWGYLHNRGLFEESGYQGAAVAVVTDGRFRNEILNVRCSGGIAVWIDRPSARTGPSVGVPGHASERLNEIPSHFYDAIIVNDGTLKDLRDNVDRFMERFGFTGAQSSVHGIVTR